MKPARARNAGGRVPIAGYCNTCGKAQFLSRADARAALKQMRNKRSGMHAYECGRYWHLGTLPPEVRRGVIDKDAMTPAVPRERADRRNRRRRNQ